MHLLRVLLIALPALAACVPPVAVQSYQQQYESRFRSAPAVRGDEFDKNITILGIERAIPGASLSDYFLRSFVDRTSGVAAHQALVSHYYSGDWIFWDRASAAGGDDLEFVQIKRDVGSCGAYTGCTFTETFGVMIPEGALRRASTGYAFKVYATTGRQMIIRLDSAQIAGQLEALESIRRKINSKNGGG